MGRIHLREQYPTKHHAMTDTTYLSLVVVIGTILALALQSTKYR